jgi:hypothetical protein
LKLFSLVLTLAEGFQDRVLTKMALRDPITCETVDASRLPTMAAPKLSCIAPAAVDDQDADDADVDDEDDDADDKDDEEEKPSGSSTANGDTRSDRHVMPLPLSRASGVM